MTNLRALLDRTVEARHRVSADRALLIAVTGIDGCGKTHLTTPLVESIERQGLRTAAIHIDGWLNLPAQRFDPSNPAEHFYLHAIRFDELFSQLVLPLREHRSVHCEANFAEETATQYRRQRYDFENVDVIVLEGIYLLKRAFQPLYDLSCWIDCSFETALTRAVHRAQEHLPEDQTAVAYRTIYFPAQEIHFARDRPQDAASMRFNNDAAPAPSN